MTLDLAKLGTVQHFITQHDVAIGTYTKVRLHISRVRVMVGGREFLAEASVDTVTTARPFTVAEGKTSIAYLYFDGERSLLRQADSTFKVVPVVQLLAQEPSRGKESKTQPSPAPTKDALAALGSTPLPNLKGDDGKPRLGLDGKIEAAADSGVVVQGKRVELSGNTDVNALLAQGGKA
ncbi:MAG: hypothetical protein HY261_04640, partial [Chloroflexi bacterium]|nr:hypothetical protein [Chloroflexota bacterium]